MNLRNYNNFLIVFQVYFIFCKCPDTFREGCTRVNIMFSERQRGKLISLFHVHGEESEENGARVKWKSTETLYCSMGRPFALHVNKMN